MNIGLRLAASSILGLAIFILVVFLPAGTVNYWQGWAFIAVFTVVTTVPTAYLARKHPAALQRRMHAGPNAETRPAQKVICTFAFAILFVIIAFSALDHRMGWSTVPVWLRLCANLTRRSRVGPGPSAFAAMTTSVRATKWLAEPLTIWKAR